MDGLSGRWRREGNFIVLYGVGPAGRAPKPVGHTGTQSRYGLAAPGRSQGDALGELWNQHELEEELEKQGIGKGTCYAGRKCDGKVLGRRIKHCHNCKNYFSGKSLLRADGVCEKC